MSIFGAVSAAGGFDKSEVDFITQLISSGQTTIDEVANHFGVPRDVVASAYAENVPVEENNGGLFADLQKANTLFNAGKDIYTGLTTPATSTVIQGVGANSPYAISLGGSDAAIAADPTATFTGGLSSAVGILSGQESTAETAGLAVLSAFNPAAALAYRLFDAMDLFGGSLLNETPMTAEEKADYQAQQKLDFVSNAANLSGFDRDWETSP